MHGIDFWRLSGELTIIQAALLICGYNPTDLQDDAHCNNKNYPDGYVAIKHALTSAAKSEVLRSRETKVFYERDGDYYIDDDLALLNVGDLKKWLLSKGIRKHFFFFPEEPEGEFLSSEHPRYSPKLAAAVRAWQAMGDDNLHAKTPKQSVKKWLRLHSTKYGLSDDDGKPMESAIEEIAKIVNWNPKGGAPSTPNGLGNSQPTAGLSTRDGLGESFTILNEKYMDDEIDPTDHIPF